MQSKLGLENLEEFPYSTVFIGMQFSCRRAM